jgi:hypothetical protein
MEQRHYPRCALGRREDSIPLFVQMQDNSFNDGQEDGSRSHMID